MLIVPNFSEMSSLAATDHMPAKVYGDLCDASSTSAEITLYVHPSDAEYAAHVQRTYGMSEQDVDQSLATRATLLNVAALSQRPLDSPSATGLDIRRPSQYAAYTRTLSSASAFSTVTASSAAAILASDCVCPSSPRAAPIVLATPARLRSKALTFAHYDKYLTQLDPNIKQPDLVKHPKTSSGSKPNTIHAGTRITYITFKNGFRDRVGWRRKTSIYKLEPLTCVCCREDFERLQDVYKLPCGHTYCRSCLHVMIHQARSDESKMPPRCCTQPIPTWTVKQLLSRDEQQEFLQAVLQYSTPWEARLFCPNATCNEFIPPRTKVDPKQPFVVTCKECRLKVCTICKKSAHVMGQDCPNDWELEAVLKMGENSGWRRCHKCRTLVELTDGCTHMTCRCKAQFCYICGSVWDTLLGCPAFCNGEEELERRRQDELARQKEQEAQKAAQEAAVAAAELEHQESLKRTAKSLEFSRLRDEQEDTLARFLAFDKRLRWLLCSDSTAKKLAVNSRYADQILKMHERHGKTEQHLEERQIASEMELRVNLEQAERSIKIRVRHMEAFCSGLGSVYSPTEPMSPARVVTERHLRELGQQHHVLDGMARLHQSRINVMRDQQAKRMEELLQRQRDEMKKVEEKREEEIEDLAAEYANEEDVLNRLFHERKMRLVKRWKLEVEVLRAEQEQLKGVSYASMPLPEWPAIVSTDSEL